MAKKPPINARPAIYLPVEDLDEAGNPFIEALPPVWTRAELMEGLTRYLNNFVTLRKARVEVRLIALHKIKQYFQPSRRDLDLAFDLVAIIRAGYLNRNPTGTNFIATLKRGIAALAHSGHDPDPEHAASGMVVLGVSGVGKTTSVRTSLECLPRVIRHEEYRGVELRTHQVVWHKINCPKQGGVMRLCKDFIESIDRLLGENYVQKYNLRRASKDDVEGAMTAIANAHGLGILVIDEIQNLKRATIRDRAVTLTFFTSLMNGLGVPVMFVGTKDAWPIIQGAVPTARRTAGAFHDFPRFTLGAEFDIFMEGLWEYQLVDDPVPLEVSEPASSGRKHQPPVQWISLFYHYSQGILDIAVKLFVETQRRALALSMRGGRSTITPELVKLVWEDRFTLMHGHIEGLRRNREPAGTVFADDLERLNVHLDDGLGEMDEVPEAEPKVEIVPDPVSGSNSILPEDELPDGLDQDIFNDGSHPLSDVRGPFPARPLSKTARARALGKSATPEALARAAAKPTQSTLAKIIADGKKNGLAPHEAVRKKGKQL